MFIEASAPHTRPLQPRQRGCGSAPVRPPAATPADSYLINVSGYAVSTGFTQLKGQSGHFQYSKSEHNIMIMSWISIYIVAT